MTQVRVADVLAPSFANGPGARFVVWVQGCTLRCAGCHNPHTWTATAGRLVDVADLIRRYDTISGLRGLTLSGGEPFEQAEACATLARLVRERGGDVVVFSGHTLAELRQTPGASALLGVTDVLVDGRYERDRPSRAAMRSSENQQIHLLTRAIQPEDVATVPRNEWVGGPFGGRLSGLDVRRWVAGLSTHLER